MLTVNDDGRFVLPTGADQEFTHFLERNGVACVGIGQVRSPFDPAKIQALYLEWIKRKQRRITRNIIILPIVLYLLIILFYFIYCGSYFFGNSAFT
jgi:hypothetical protein